MIEIKQTLLIGPLLAMGAAGAFGWCLASTRDSGAPPISPRILLLQTALALAAGWLLQPIFDGLSQRFPPSTARTLALATLGFAYGLILLVSPAFRLRTPVLGMVAGFFGAYLIHQGEGFETSRIAGALAFLAAFPLLGLMGPESFLLRYAPCLFPRLFRRGQV